MRSLSSFVLTRPRTSRERKRRNSRWGATGNQESNEFDVCKFNVPAYQGMQETCVSVNTDEINGTRARVVEPRLYSCEVAPARGGGDAPWYEHRESDTVRAAQERWVLAWF